jgi:hypothetical protein
MAFTSVSPCKPLPPIKETIPELLLAAAKKFHDQGRTVYLVYYLLCIKLFSIFENNDIL